jgi:hypothetical protein
MKWLFCVLLVCTSSYAVPMLESNNNQDLRERQIAGAGSNFVQMDEIVAGSVAGFVQVRCL